MKEYIVPVNNTDRNNDEIFVGFIRRREELIRCKYCFWYRIAELKTDGTTDKRYKPTWCGFWENHMNPDDYCSMGNRKVVEEE